MRASVDIFPTRNTAGRDLAESLRWLMLSWVDRAKVTVHQDGNPGAFLKASMLSDLVIFDGTVAPSGEHNYDLSPSIQRNFDHVLFVGRSYFPINVHGMRRGGAPTYPYLQSNAEIIEWTREQLNRPGERLHLPRPLQEKLSLGIGSLVTSTRKERESRRSVHQVFLSYRGNRYEKAKEIKERIERGDFHPQPKRVMLYAPEELALSDEVLSALLRWNVLSIISDVIRECEEFWVLESPDYLESWWTRGELATFAYFGNDVTMRIYNLEHERFREPGPEYRPKLSEQHKSRMSRLFANSHPDLMAPESMQAMRQIKVSDFERQFPMAHDIVFTQEFWNYPLLQCDVCSTVRREGGQGFKIDDFLENKYPVLYPISPDRLERAVQKNELIKCPNPDCRAEYQVSRTPPRYLWYPLPVGPDRTYLEEIKTYRIVRVANQA